jgi:hypothetical protein
MTWSTTGIHMDSTGRRDYRDRRGGVVAWGAAVVEEVAAREEVATAPEVVATGQEVAAAGQEVAAADPEVAAAGPEGRPLPRSLQAARRRPGL